MDGSRARTPGGGGDDGVRSRFPRRQIRNSIPKTDVNPFCNDAPWTTYEICKAVFIGLTLFPIRLILFFVCVIGCATFAAISLIGMDGPTFRAEKPLSALRRAILRPVGLFCRGGLLAFGFHRIKSYHKYTDTHATPPLIVANHLSLIDGLYFQYYYGMAALAKGDAANIPIIGRIFRAFQFIFVDRSSAESRKLVTEQIRARVHYPDDGNHRYFPLVVFPEGTTTNGRVIISFKPGAFQPGVAVLPVCLRLPYTHYNPCFAGRNETALSALRMMLQFYNCLEVIELDAYFPSPDEIADPVLFANNVRAKMAARLGVPVTEHSYDDMYLTSSATRANVAQDFEMLHFKKVFNVEVAQVKSLLHRFQGFDLDKDGRIGIVEFCGALGLDSPPSPYAQNLFRFLDEDQQGAIDFVTFVHGLSLFSEHASTDDQIRFAFHINDSEASGNVSCADMSEHLNLAVTAGLCKPIPELAQWFRESDRSNNGYLDFSQFAALLRTHPSLLDASIRLARSRLGNIVIPDPQAASELPSYSS